MKQKMIFITFFAAVLQTFCVPHDLEARRYEKRAAPKKLSRINIIDSNGFSETISDVDRLAQYERVNFLAPQPYQKVLRIYKRSPEGNVEAFINSYYENGQPKQYLEVVNNSASGNYFEWHENGQKKIEAIVVGGAADIDASSQNSYLFDHTAKVYDQEGCISALLPYEKGYLHGTSLYYHPNGAIWKKAPFFQGELYGVYEVFTEDQKLLQSTEFKNGLKDGKSIRFFPNGTVSSEEFYERGFLLQGTYRAIDNREIASVIEGAGTKVVFGKTEPVEMQQFQNGVLEGKVQVFGKDGLLSSTFHMKNGKKHGEEVIYYERTKLHRELTPKVSINWYEDMIQGTVKTWYENGIRESQKEMSGNQKTGLSSAWYRNGSLMLVEEYDQNSLIKGTYYKMNDPNPVSQIEKGNGVCTLHDAEGNFVRKTTYVDGWPSVE